jgi:anti-sigma regulatory factor (Ser/Thr protein kinase)
MKLIRCEEHDACASQLCKIRASVRDTCKSFDFPEDEINLITLAIDEACTNIIRYAYCGDMGRIVLQIFQDNNQAIFRLRDFGPCIDGACLEFRKNNLLEPGGLGLQLIHKVMDSVELIPPPEPIGNILELKKHLPKGCH